MKDIYGVLAEKQRHLSALQKEVDALRLAIKLTADEESSESSKKLSQPLMVVSILEEAGKPLHVKEITERMKKQFHITVKTNNIGVMLHRYAARERHFLKYPFPNTYGLRKWQADESKIASVA